MSGRVHLDAALLLPLALALACSRPQPPPPPSSLQVPAPPEDAGRRKPAPREVPLPHGIGWRGDGSGRYPDATPPLHWSSGKNLAWKTPMPGRGNATPVVLGDRLFVTAEPDLLLAVRASDGVVLWQRQVTLAAALAASGETEMARRIEESERAAVRLREAEVELALLKREARREKASDEARARLTGLQQTIGSLQEKLRHGVSAGAPPGSFVGDAAQTPVTDGRSVFVAYGSFVAASFDLDGNQRWIRYLPHPELPRREEERPGIGGSPLLAGDRLVVPMMELYGLDPDTGQVVWTLPGMQQWGTPARVEVDGEDYVITPAGRIVRAWDGEVVAEPTVPSRFVGPVASESLVLFSGLDMTPESSPISRVEAFRLPERLGGGAKLTSLWKQAVGHGDYYGAPVVDEGRLFALNDEGHRLQVIDLNTGSLLHERPLPIEPGMPVPSLAVAGRHLHISFEEGGTYVLSTQAPWRQLAHNRIEDTLRASPAFGGSRMFLRGYQSLYCFSEADTKAPRR